MRIISSLKEPEESVDRTILSLIQIGKSARREMNIARVTLHTWFFLTDPRVQYDPLYELERI